ncbi:hypothetical protein [Euzebya rosea]|uniref:hypothetical protein n=1 Tax=Euzebya rosea TaxID=2052804 RepID=UPI000D3E0CD0|nr:hypothetical protein [Euzebya rosea]
MGVVTAVVLTAVLISGCAGSDLPGMAEVFDVPADGSHVLTRGDDWQLVVTPAQHLEHRYDRGVSGVGEYTRPITLTEATEFATTRNGQPITLVAGPVDDRTVRVEVESLQGVMGDAAVVRAHGLTWFWLELPGDDDGRQVTAYDDDGEIIDQRR